MIFTPFCASSKPTCTAAMAATILPHEYPPGRGRHYLKWPAEEDQRPVALDPNRQPPAGDPTEPEVETATG